MPQLNMKLSPVTCDRLMWARTPYSIGAGACLVALSVKGCLDAGIALRNPQMNPVLRSSTASVVTVVFSFMSIVSGCKSAPAPAPQDQAAAPAQAAPAAPPAVPMSVDDLVAPIALYPDQLLAQILTASTNAQEVLDGETGSCKTRTSRAMPSPPAKQAGFSPPMQYLMSFPQVVDNMCQQMDWTHQLGQSFQPPEGRDGCRSAQARTGAADGQP